MFLILSVTFPVAYGENGVPETITTDSVPIILTALNVGKADCLLLQTEDITYMIDTGRGASWEIIESALNRLGISRLDGVILTHTDSDHAGGLKKLIKSDISVSHVYASSYYILEEGKSHPAEKALKKSPVEAVYLSAGATLPFGSASLKVIGPLTPDSKEENNNSLVLLASGGGGNILLTGDMEFPEEYSLLDANVFSHVDILKVANHGDDDATSEALLNRLTPDHAVISTSTAEKADTPSPRVLRLLENLNTKVYQTQETETGIRFTLVNGEVTVETF